VPHPSGFWKGGAFDLHLLEIQKPIRFCQGSFTSSHDQLSQCAPL
jgi:hypothetical protein